jgi:hypothetical protein
LSGGRREEKKVDPNEYEPSPTVRTKGLKGKTTKTKTESQQRKTSKRARNHRACEPCLVEGPTTIFVITWDTWANAEELFPGGESDFVPLRLKHPSFSEISTSNPARQKHTTRNDRARQLEDAAENIREQKAVKTDDVAVPKHLWEQYLFDNNPKWEKHKGRFRAACEVLREGMLAFCQKAATTLPHEL